MTPRRPSHSAPRDSQATPEPELTSVLTFAVMKGPSAVVVTDAAGLIVFVNRKFSELTGYSAAEAVGQKASLLKSGQMPAATYRRLWTHLRSGADWTGEFHNRKKDGSLYWEQASISPIHDSAGRVRHYLKIAEDITVRKQLEEELRVALDRRSEHAAQLAAANRQLASTLRALKATERKLQRQSHEDSLTGLLNRRGFEAELVRVKALAERQGRGVGFLVIDIDHFKQINDRYGHAAGDRLLQSFAELLRSRLRASDLLCRYGGDEVVVALPSATDASTQRAAERLLSAVRRHRFAGAGEPISFTVSIGAACGLPAPGLPLEQVMKRADRALYRVKRSGRNGVALAAACDEQAPSPEAATRPQPHRPAFGPLLAALEARDAATAEHCRRVSALAAVLARELRLPAEQTERLVQSALLHDIGKVAVPDAILLKPGALTETERAAVSAHAQAGHAILSACPELQEVSEIVLSHHERVDGSGYPRGLKGKRISLEARILAVADTYDAIRAGRPYCASRTPDDALRELRRCNGALFDATVVAALTRRQSELEAALYASPAAR